MSMKPFKHQATEWANRARQAQGLLWDMRTGKSKSVIDKAYHLYECFEIKGVLVIAPNGVHRNWTDLQIPEHAWELYPAAFAWQFSNPNNFEDYMQFLGNDGLLWMVVNMEVIIRDEVAKAIRYFLKCINRDGMIVFDESHHFSSPGAKRTKRARSLAKAFPYRMILSGTESEDSPLQSYSQFELLYPEALGHKTYADFKDRYSEWEIIQTKSRSFPKLVGYKNLDELKARKAKYVTIIQRKDCDDLPEIQLDRRIIEMTPKQHKLWRDVKQRAIDTVAEYNIKAGGATMFTLQQIEGGFISKTTPDEQTGRKLREVKGVIPPLKNAKLNAIKDELNTCKGSMIIWCMYIHEIKAVEAMLSQFKPVLLYGATSVDARHQALRDFQSKRRRIIISQPKAGGEGTEMSVAEKIIWYSGTPSATVRKQAMARASKIGGHSIQVIDLVVPGGIDEYFLELITKKSTIAEDMKRFGITELLGGINVRD